MKSMHEAGVRIRWGAAGETYLVQHIVRPHLAPRQGAMRPSGCLPLSDLLGHQVLELDGDTIVIVVIGIVNAASQTRRAGL